MSRRHSIALTAARYLQAAGARPDKVASNRGRDADWQQQLVRFHRTKTTCLDQDRMRGARDNRVDEFRWMLEEARVSLWAQQLNPPYLISFKRLEKYWSEL